jgi:hypothetical protein
MVVSRCLSGLRLNTVEQLSGAIGAELATNIEPLAGGCDHALHKGRVAVESFRVEVCRPCCHESDPRVACHDPSRREQGSAYRDRRSDGQGGH